MAKLMTLVKSPPGMEHAAFRAFWRDEFLPAVLELETAGNHIYKAVHNQVLPTNIRDEEHIAANSWGGISSYYFDSRAAAEAFLVDPAYKALLEANRDKLPEVAHLLVDEIWMYNRDKSHLPIKAFAFFKRKPTITREEAHAYYRGPHAEIGAGVNKNRTVRYIQNHVLPGFHPADLRYDYDAGPEIWFKNMDIALDLFNDQEAMDALAEDEERFVLRNELLHFLTDEEVVLDKQPAAEEA